MHMPGTAAAVGAAAYAAIADAIKASGVVVRVDAGDFLAILKRVEEPLVVTSYGGVFRKQHKYLTSYKGLAFFTKSPSALLLSARTEIVRANKISIPEL
jgi:hypothetical protein